MTWTNQSHFHKIILIQFSTFEKKWAKWNNNNNSSSNNNNKSDDIYTRLRHRKFMKLSKVDTSPNCFPCEISGGTCKVVQTKIAFITILRCTSIILMLFQVSSCSKRIETESKKQRLCVSTETNRSIFQLLICALRFIDVGEDEHYFMAVKICRIPKDNHRSKTC